MLRARLSNGHFLMGLDRTNVERLTHGEPIIIDLRLMGGTDVVMLDFGETLTLLQAKWEKLQGQKLPVPQVLPDNLDPQ